MMNTLAFISPGGGELILIMLVLIMLFGAKDAPRMLRKFQSFMDEIRKIANGFRYDMMYSDLHSDDQDTATKPAFDESEAEDGDFEEYDFEDDYGSDEDEPGPLAQKPNARPQEPATEDTDEVS